MVSTSMLVVPEVAGRGRVGRWLLALVLVPLLLTSAPLLAQDGAQNERSNFWRAVRGGDAGYSAVSGPEAGVLIQNGGENWRALREGPLRGWGGWIIAGVFGLAALFLLMRGRDRLDATGVTVERFKAFERAMHWTLATTVIVLALTGFSLMYGRELLIPLIGKDAHAAWAGIAMTVHNYLGPFFVVILLVMAVTWLRDNLFKRMDLEWFKAGGGLFGHHAPAGRFNGGEKVQYWWLVSTGLLLAVTGGILDFPIFGQSREMMQISHVLHVIGAVMMLIAVIGHIAIAIHTTGAIQGMTSGRVDVEWARKHHDQWYEDMLRKGGVDADVSHPRAREPGANSQPAAN